MTRTTLGDFEVNYEMTGSGPAVILVHGLAEDLRSWDPLLPALSDFTVYALDVRGHGGSSVGDGDGTLAQLAADLERFVQKVSGPAAVVGYSLGGTIALRAAADADTAIRHVIAVASSSVVGRGAADFFAGRIAQIESHQWDEFAAGLRSDTSQQVVTAPDLDALTATRLVAVGDGDGYVNAARAMIGVRSSPLTNDLARIKVAVDVVGADQDVFCPRKAADLIVEGVPRGRYHEIEGAGHLISVDQPARYGSLISRLLKEVA